MNRNNTSLLRRRLLQAAGAAALALRSQLSWGQSPTTAEPPRLALLIGNREYPDGEDLPPIHKNVRDLKRALEARGFKVSQGLDLDLPQASAAMASFAAEVRAAPADSTVFFYFSGHGAQVDAENLLVSARLSPKAVPDNLVRGSLTLTKGVVGQLPLRPLGLTIAVIDACRTSLRDVAVGQGLNQVEAPPGCLIAFATGAGRPAIAPADDTRNTFYTDSLVRLLDSSSGEITFSDLFRLVKTDVHNVMINHPVPLLRRFAQVSFIAENTQVRRRLAPQVPVAADASATAAAPARFASRDEAADWSQLETTVWPGDVSRLAVEYLRNHPGTRLAGSAQVARDGALEALDILRRREVSLSRSAFQPTVAAADGYGAPTSTEPSTDLLKCGRGDKDAAARVARTHGRNSGRWDRGRYEGWLQYAAALGNGIASYELALHYRRENQPVLAAQSEARARALGYTPPPSLDNTRK